MKMYYSNAHRMFMQVLIRLRMMDEAKAKELMQQCFEETGVSTGKVPKLEDFVSTINKELKYMELSVMTATEEREDGDYPCLVLINLMAGELTQSLSSFTKQEISFIHKLVGEIVSSETGELETNTALNIGPTLSPKMTISASESLLQTLIRSNWLLQSKNDEGDYCVSLSGLAITEFATYLEEAYEDIPKCFFCTKITFKGHHCEQCNTSVHRDCGKKYWTNRGGGNVCPGEGCNASLLSSQGSSSQGKRKRRDCNGTEDSMDEEEEPETQQKERADRKKKNKERRDSGRSRRTREASNISYGDDSEDE